MRGSRSWMEVGTEQAVQGCAWWWCMGVDDILWSAFANVGDWGQWEGCDLSLLRAGGSRFSIWCFCPAFRSSLSLPWRQRRPSQPKIIVWFIMLTSLLGGIACKYDGLIGPEPNTGLCFHIAPMGQSQEPLWNRTLPGLIASSLQLPDCSVHLGLWLYLRTALPLVKEVVTPEGSWRACYSQKEEKPLYQMLSSLGLR